MRKLTAILISIITLSVIAQNREPARIKASYTFTEVRRHVDGHDFEENSYFILMTSAVGSRFFCKSTEQYDSLMAIPGGKEKYREMLNYAAANALIIENGGISIDRSKVDIPRKGKILQVSRPDNSDILIVVDCCAQEEFTYDVQMNELQWELSDSTKKVFGYDCLLACADYHGRKWYAWFSPEIPIQSGPWQLMGLPGLIMEAETDGGEYKFIINGLESINEPIRQRPGVHSYTPTDRKRFRKFQWEICRNPEKAYPEGNATITNASKVATARTAHNLIETDYK